MQQLLRLLLAVAGTCGGYQCVGRRAYAGGQRVQALSIGGFHPAFVSPPRFPTLFETLINVVHKAAPDAAIAFNAGPETTADAAARSVARG